MKLLIAGGDMRYAYAACLAARRGLNVESIGLENSGLPVPRGSLDAVSRADAVLMPNPWRAAFPVTYAAQPVQPSEIIARLGAQTALILPDVIGMPPDFPRRIVNLSQDEGYLLRNARLTAEGAIHAAMSSVPFALEGAEALVIGYGRIARRLTALLLALGCPVTVAARREEALRLAASEGAASCPLDHLPGVIGRFRLIFSTPPAAVLDDRLLQGVSREALLMDLASPPFGFSLTRALELGRHAARENNLPGRYCPESAGAILLDALLAAVEKGGFS